MKTIYICRSKFLTKNVNALREVTIIQKPDQWMLQKMNEGRRKWVGEETLKIFKGQEKEKEI